MALADALGQTLLAATGFTNKNLRVWIAALAAITRPTRRARGFPGIPAPWDQNPLRAMAAFPSQRQASGQQTSTG